jgi:hypothetical protein
LERMRCAFSTTHIASSFDIDPKPIERDKELYGYFPTSMW